LLSSFQVEFLQSELRPTTNASTDPSPTGSLTEASKTIAIEWPPPPKSSSRTFLTAAVTCRNEYCAEIGRESSLLTNERKMVGYRDTTTSVDTIMVGIPQQHDKCGHSNLKESYLISGKLSDILIRDGNAVDAAIATVVCTGAVEPHATGFGGGLLMLVHDRAINETVLINAVSIAPRTATEETYLANPNLAKLGYSSIGTPGFLHGIWTAFKRFGSGRIAWQDLLLPTINLLERGYPVSADFVSAVRSRFHEIITEKSMR
ncbi:hypothetical protein OESDEN_12163, partial [Oesophagostomum dentatum]